MVTAWVTVSEFYISLLDYYFFPMLALLSKMLNTRVVYVYQHFATETHLDRHGKSQLAVQQEVDHLLQTFKETAVLIGGDIFK